MTRLIQCTEVWGGTGACDVSVQLAGVRGECFSRPHEGSKAGGDIHFLSVCGMSILSKVVLADVSGHGQESAEVSGIIHDALIENIGAHDNSSMLARLNEAFLARRTGAFRFTTMTSLIIDSRDRSLVYAYAGHPSILHGSRKTRCFARVRAGNGADGGLPLGVLTGTEYAQHAVQLEQGDILAVYSDAFIEARVGGELLGENGLARLLESAPSMEPPDLKEHVFERLGSTFDDDASLIILEVQ